MKLKIIACDIYKKEIHKCLDLAKYINEDIEICTYSPVCGLEKHSSPLEGLYDDNTQTIAFACSEFLTLGDDTCFKGPKTNAYNVYNVSQCFELVLNRELVNHLQKNGAMLVTPGGLENWQRLKKSINKTTNQVLLLDTGIEPNAAIWLEEFSSYSGLPTEILPVGIDTLKLILHSLIDEFHKEAIISAQAERIQSLSDQVFALGTIAGFAKVKTEQEAIETIRALMLDLFGPQDVYFAPHSQELTIGLNSEELIQWDNDINGFLLTIRYGEQHYGTLVVKKILYPEYRERYLNLLYYIAELSGLAFSNARAFDEIRRKDEEIYLSNERFSKAFEMSPEAMVIYSLNKNIILDVNQSFERDTGYCKKEIIGRDFLASLLDEGELKRKILFEKDGVTNLEILYADRAGKRHEGLLSSKKVKINGEECVLVTCQDVTKLNRLQREMDKYARLEAVGEMAAAIAHEIRNPMTTVKGYLQLLQDKDAISMYKEKFELMIDELDYANRIITDYLSLARNRGVDSKVINLNQVIQSIYSLAQATSHLREITINLQLGDIPDLNADETEIRQLIINLIQNGMDSMTHGGTLTVATFTSDSVILEITDEGCGISPEVLEKLGTPFFTTKPTGTGLGLAVCYSIAARYNAKIDFRSSTSGTTVSVSFPMS